ncbi:C-Jun-amino-terminal kinase-interacting protein 3 [Chelonia mydas]|uniref:C-Jun-amino-terminal kinase-interacting protein 3 n=1 Tax=Chelonia mydas TaxID=8469 RepID=M7AVP6_CHEMY|nr:C-Jun-amino-terminal kinase-interacting protein 3 [Chelonia mydas]
MELEDAVEQERKGHRAALSRLDGQSRRLEEEARSYADQCSPQRCQELAEILSSTPELDPTPDLPASPPTPQRNMESLFAEVSGLSLELLGDVDEGADLQGDAVQTLMMENAELRDTRIRQELEEIKKQNSDDAEQQKRDLYRQIRSHIWKQHGRAPVHGWSPPAVPQGAPQPAPPSLVWVCSGTHSASEVTVMDAARANLVLAQFVLPNTHVLCAAWLPGHRPPSAESMELEPEILEDPLAPDPPELEEEMGTLDADSDGIGTTDTVWLGTQEGSHAQGRAVVALGNGTVVVFHRDVGEVDGSCRIPLDERGGSSQWYFEVTGHPESQVRHMVLAGDGVWVSVRLDPTLRLFHAATGQPLQEIDLTPFVHSIFGPNTLAVSLHFSALGCFSQRLWIGTASGTVLTVPFAPEFSGRSEPAPATGSQPGPSPASTPYCAMESAQASYHGHRDAVRFFVCVPGDDTDDQFGDLLVANPHLRRSVRSHLIVWQVRA